MLYERKSLLKVVLKELLKGIYVKLNDAHPVTFCFALQQKQQQQQQQQQIQSSAITVLFIYLRKRRHVLRLRPDHHQAVQ
jgi:hypothetical protein